MAARRVSQGLAAHTSLASRHGLRSSVNGWRLSTLRDYTTGTEANGTNGGRPSRRIVEKHVKLIFPTDEDVGFTSRKKPRDMRLQKNSIEVCDDDRKLKQSVWRSLSPRWLRDHCKCASCMNQDTGQRQINVLKGDIDCTITNVRESEDGKAVAVTFGDGHITTISKHLIVDRGTLQYRARHSVVDVRTWTASVKESPPTVQYDDVQKDGLGQLLKNIRVNGFSFIEGTPPTPEATQSLLEAIGPIRNTHYGGFYDFTSDLSSKDTAYTSESLEPHNDNTYFTEPAGLQALHLLSHTEGSGGESSLVDGFAAARQLFRQDRDSYRRLAQQRVYGHASGNEGVGIQPAEAFAVLTHHAQLGSLMQVRWNNADRAGVNCTYEHLDEWYDAASKFDAILSDPQNQYWFRLTPGKLLIFDNWRILHGRTAFTGKRRMCGGYINRDDWVSRYRQTNMSTEDIQDSTVTG